MSYQSARAFPCVPGKRYHAWGASKAWGIQGARVCEWQACVRCGCERSRMVNLVVPRAGRGWQYADATRLPGEVVTDD